MALLFSAAMSILTWPVAMLGAQAEADVRPTLAIMPFTNGALIAAADYAPLSKGIAELLLADLSANEKIRLVERDRLEEILTEQRVQTANDVDPTTAVRLGTLLGAQHFLAGGFTIDPKRRVRLDVRSINVETGRVEYVETVQGKADDILELVATLGDKVARGLSLPPMAARSADTGHGAKDSFRAALQFGRALAAKDRGDVSAAIAAAQEALVSYPDFRRARALLNELKK